MKPTAVMDIECYRNYFLVGFRHVETGRIKSFEMYDGQPLDVEAIKRVIFNVRIVTFNGINYDMPMLVYALRGATCNELKERSDSIIRGQLKGWQSEQLFECKVPTTIDHIDLMEVAPGVMVSLKQYGGRMHSQRLQDLPYDPDELITPERRQVVFDYWKNDLQTTVDLWNKLTDGEDDVIGIRERIGAEAKMDLRSKSDAQMAEAIIRSTVEKLKREKIYKPDIPAGTLYKYRPPAFIRFASRQMLDALAMIEAADFILQPNGKIAEPQSIADASIKIGTSVYTMGIGGLHSTEKRTTHVADQDVSLVDRDVVSFYPMLIKQCGLSPRNMGGHFQRVYCDFIDRRIAAKKAGHKTTAQTLKIYLNGAYGKLGSPFSVLFAPDLLIQVTITGQLVLLMMIERMEAAGIPVVSANTDGIVIKCPRAMEPTMLAIVAQWERDTGFETEETRYRALCSRDINNYIALKEKGGYKAKGAYAAPGLQKNPQNVICNEAAAAFLEHGTPVAETVLKCRDVRKFLTVRAVSGGAIRITKTRFDDTLTTAKKRPVLLAAGVLQMTRDEWASPDTGVIQDTDTAYRELCGVDEYDYLGKVVRWVRARGETGSLHYKKKNKSGNHNRVAGSEGAMPLMELPDTMPPEIDYGWYIAETNEILKDIGALNV